MYAVYMFGPHLVISGTMKLCSVCLIIVSMVYCTCVFLKLGASIYVAMDLIPILLGSLPLAHNA